MTSVHPAGGPSMLENQASLVARSQALLWLT